VTAAKALGTEPSTTVLNRLEELMHANEHGLKKKDAKSSTVERKSDVHRGAGTLLAAATTAVSTTVFDRERQCTVAGLTDIRTITTSCNSFNSSSRIC